MAHPNPHILITTGEPSGVGIEVTLKALRNHFDATITLLGDANWIQQINQLGGWDLNIESIQSLADASPHTANHIQVLHRPMPYKAQLGKLDKRNGQYVVDLLNQAHQFAHKGEVDAIVTAPVHKGVINDAGVPFTGHTELFAALSGVERVVMMLASEPMRVALVTTHIPLQQVASALTESLIHQVLDVTVKGLQTIGIANPRIKVLGLNPHAGEQGHLGQEELETIIPALQSLPPMRATITGPYPADTAFNQASLKSTDLFLAMFHDQGLPVIKFASFGQCANVTLGLPYIRTSVDHGTALDIAPQLEASESSMNYAITFAIDCARNQNTAHNPKTNSAL